MKSDRALGKALAFMARGINRILRPFLHREYLSEHRATPLQKKHPPDFIEFATSPGTYWFQPF